MTGVFIDVFDVVEILGSDLSVYTAFEFNKLSAPIILDEILLLVEVERL